jgi:hypothetical protein
VWPSFVYYKKGCTRFAELYGVHVLSMLLLLITYTGVQHDLNITWCLCRLEVVNYWQTWSHNGVWNTPLKALGRKVWRYQTVNYVNIYKIENICHHIQTIVDKVC